MSIILFILPTDGILKNKIHNIQVLIKHIPGITQVSHNIHDVCHYSMYFQYKYSAYSIQLIKVKIEKAQNV